MSNQQGNNDRLVVLANHLPPNSRVPSSFGHGVGTAFILHACTLDSAPKNCCIELVICRDYIFLIFVERTKVIRIYFPANKTSARKISVKKGQTNVHLWKPVLRAKWKVIHSNVPSGEML
jgi:hypothetical protein